MKINRFLTRGTHAVLKRMRDDPDADGEIVWEKGAGWWVGNHRTSASVGKGLLQLCLLHDEGGNSENFKRYTLNSDGRNIIDNVNYVPTIILSLRTLRKKMKET
jgi:hypothetical protein